MSNVRQKKVSKAVLIISIICLMRSEKNEMLQKKVAMKANHIRRVKYKIKIFG